MMLNSMLDGMADDHQCPERHPDPSLEGLWVGLVVAAHTLRATGKHGHYQNEGLLQGPESCNLWSLS